jgi:hypothetical protein
MKNNKIKIALCTLALSLSANAAIEIEQSILNMNVIKDGIYRVSNDDISGLNVDLTGTNINNIAVMFNGQKVPAKIFSTTGTFNNESYIEFIGKAGDSIYQTGNVYTLTLSSNLSMDNSDLEPQENLDTVSHYAQSIIQTENTRYSPSSPVSDPWYKQRIVAIGAEKTAALNFEIDNLASQGQVNVEMSIWGGTNFPVSPDHHVIYELNNNNIDDFRFDGITSQNREYTVDLDSISSGSNQLTIRVPNDTDTAADLIHVESFKISYPRNFALMDKQLDFKIDLSNSTNNSEIFFSDGFEDVTTSNFSPINNYKISHANNETFRVYQENPNGSVTEINTLSSANCDVNVASDCHLNFSVLNNSGYVYVSAESEIAKPLLTLPIMLTDINESSASYDYLIISHPDFIGAELDEFIALKELNYSVKLVDVEQIYAQYGHSNISAQSIANYIHFAAKDLNIRQVLLVGGDTYDYKNYLGVGSISFIPTLYGSTGDLINFAPIDPKFADIDNDNIPDIGIGRLPVRTVTELDSITQKILAYENKTYSTTSVFAADKYDVNNNYSFKDDAESMINVLPVEWQSNITIDNKAFIDDDGVDLAKAKITNNINQGVALTSFIGHSGPKDWSFSRLFRNSDVSLLTNIDSPTLVTQWGCWNTYFVSPTEDTLAHNFMLNPNGGAASVLGASTLTKAVHEKDLAEIVLRLLTHDQLTLGEAVTEAKKIYAQTNPDATDVILGWTILGDPSLRL